MRCPFSGGGGAPPAICAGPSDSMSCMWSLEETLEAMLREAVVLEVGNETVGCVASKWWTFGTQPHFVQNV